ncbi:transglutaminase family protein [Geobacter sulfurreducens]|uniref:Transglutaminase-like superfamily protein n=1 Tax=Geobacter sulfurreducens (strain ATCC 51573 / DSM 12127 / PCA) TaxID=243231 RepID=Q74CX2_GEOSL|nr:transglutaminase family protein [Geobacter sulfurreducens]AAR34923.1 transglutaminase-like superfamily protein [Geobacter sulfurreducens PCA]ADI84385.1 transglutaminase-like superfamily protein [Geobacter sulfurreducens KN400]AJY71567.1 Cro/Cl family transcriptional regulator [Geobacter sulfurreducens]QVW36719.1 transglutaminase family protein [Geobacter sulfurreducens]UAC05556.1 transglutaminase family protein [Geobacter sulfurreducens]
MERYLAESDIIDWKHPDILSLAAALSAGCRPASEIAGRCFEWVRDNVRHSWDYQLNPVTCTASDVLRHRTGYCYAKSHLLAALLRACGIPAGFCYQRLSLDGSGAPYCLHGLNAVFLPEHGWYRIDPRGNKEGIDARFTPPVERLAFSTDDSLEADLPEIWPEPLDCVVSVLRRHDDYRDVYANLPDVELVRTISVRPCAAR